MTSTRNYKQCSYNYEFFESVIRVTQATTRTERPSKHQCFTRSYLVYEIMDIIDYSKSINRFDLVEMLTPDAETIRRLNEAIEKRNRAVEALKLTIKEARKQIEQINKILSED